MDIEHVLGAVVIRVAVPKLNASISMALQEPDACDGIDTAARPWGLDSLE